MTTNKTEIFLPSRIYGTRFPMSQISLTCSEGKFIGIDKERQVLLHEGGERSTEWREARIEIRVAKSQDQVNRDLVGLIVGLNVITGLVWWVGLVRWWGLLRWVMKLFGFAI